MEEIKEETEQEIQTGIKEIKKEKIGFKDLKLFLKIITIGSCVLILWFLLSIVISILGVI